MCVFSTLYFTFRFEWHLVTHSRFLWGFFGYFMCRDRFCSVSFFFFLSFRATPVAYGGSQTRGLIRAVEAGLCNGTTATATWDPSCICNLHHNSQQCWILNLVSVARDWTCVLMDISQIHFRWATTGTCQYTWQTLSALFILQSKESFFLKWILMLTTLYF